MQFGEVRAEIGVSWLRAFMRIPASHKDNLARKQKHYQPFAKDLDSPRHLEKIAWVSPEQSRD